MKARPLLVLGMSLLMVAPSIAGLRVQEGGSPASPGQTHLDAEAEKELLRRLIAELEESSRSFKFLRSVGFALSDGEFEQLIARHQDILRATRIMRYDENGVRQIPGWPGVRLTPGFKSQKH